MKTVAFYTLGCKVNHYETEAMEELFLKAGYKKVDFSLPADVYIINTCTVTHHSDSKSRQMIRRARRQNPDGLVVVVGCYAQVAPDELMAIPGIDLIIGTGDKSRVIELVEDVLKDSTPVNVVRQLQEGEEFEELRLERLHKGRTRAFIKIQEGCRQFCTYCIIPYARGPLRSRRSDKVLEEVTRLVKLGYKEVVLTGIHIASYGKDLGDTNLLDIIKKIHDIEGLERIRLSSLEPTLMTENFVEEISGLDKLCRHFHLSLQSGCDETLKRMNRKYSTDEYRSIVDLLRNRIPGVAITTDVMVGFPGETDEEFSKTYEFLEEICLSNMHVFKYSTRRGTPAAKFKNQVDAQTKDKRSKMLIALAESCRMNFFDSFLGQTMEVLFEQKSKQKEGYYEGLTDNYIKVLVPFNKELHNQILEVELIGCHKDFVTGHLVD